VPRGLGDPVAQRRLAEQLQDAYLRHRGKPRWVEKTPANVHHIDVLVRLFPHARFINCVRDGRDVVCSLLEAEWFSPRFPGRFPRAVVVWVRAVEAGRRAAQVLGSKYLEVRYEEIVRNPERVIRSVLEFAEEPWEPGVLAFDRHPHDWSWSALGQRIDRPVFATSVGRWRVELTPRQQWLFTRLAGRTLTRLGYACEST
jgi:hypothetical protein